MVLDTAKVLQATGWGDSGLPGLESLPEDAVQHQGDEADRGVSADALRQAMVKR